LAFAGEEKVPVHDAEMEESDEEDNRWAHIDWRDQDDDQEAPRSVLKSHAAAALAADTAPRAPVNVPQTTAMPVDSDHMDTDPMDTS